MKYTVWKYIFNERTAEMEKVWFNGLGFSSRGSAQLMTEGEAEMKQKRLPGTMIMRVRK